MEAEFVIVDKIKLWIHKSQLIPLCLIDLMPLNPVNIIGYTGISPDNANRLQCTGCKKRYKIPRKFGEEKIYVLSKAAAKVFRGQRFINLDGEAIPIAEHKIPKDSEYFVTSVLTKSKVGLRLVVYAGKRGSNQKTQIFVEPEIRRLAFDQTNLHPTDVFTKVEATFLDGTTAAIEKEKIESKHL